MKKKLSFTSQILIATILALVVGSIVGPKIAVVEVVGSLWLRLIQMSIIVLVMTSIAGAMGNMEGAGAGKMSFATFKYIILFTISSALIGLVLGLVLKPGLGINLGEVVTPDNVVAQASILETLKNFLPTNIIQAMAEGSTIQTIVFSLIFGIAASKYREKTGSTTILNFIKDLNGVIMEIISMAMVLAPIGIFGLLAPVAGTTGLEVILPMLKFLLALLLADLIMILVYFPLTAVKLEVNPLSIPKKFAKMSLMALTTTSSAVCLPTKMEDSVTKFGVSRKVTDFTGPITMSMNSSGAIACYVIAILFMAQATGINLSIIQLMTGILLAIMMVMGTIVVPGGSIVVYTFFATSLGLPLEAIAVLIAIDWFAGALRTLMNVTIDVLVGMLVADEMDEFNKDVYDEIIEVEY